MKPRHQISRAAIILIKRFEGFRATAAQLDDGGWTIGYGHTKTARAGATVSEDDAEALLLYDLISVAHAVNEWTYAPLNQNQFDALVSFAFNIGLENFRRSTTLRRVNEGRALEAAMTMELWRTAEFEGERIVIDALVRRRAYEKVLFLKPVDAWAPAPSPVLPPRIDYEVAAMLPSQTPTVLTARLEGDRAIADRQQPVSFTAFPDYAGPSASEAAAAAVSSRLGSILADGPAEPDQSDRWEGASVAEADPELLFAPEVSRDAEVEGGLDDAAETLPSPDREGAAAPTATDLSLNMAALGDVGRTPDRPRLIGFVVLGLVGVALFAIALNWGFKPTAAGLRPWTPLLIGWGVGGLGIGCFAVAAYFLLARLGDDGPADGAS